MTKASRQLETRRSIALVFSLASVVFVIGCFVNPQGVYGPWEFTFGVSVLVLLSSMAAVLHFHIRLQSGPPSVADE